MAGSAVCDVTVVVAADHSSVARQVARDRLDVRLLTPACLSAPGWVLDPCRPLEGTAHLGGAIVRNDEIGLVIVALEAVDPSHLPDVVAADREFVAEEMTAFLRTWLTGLGPAVLDPPTPTNLAGRGTDNRMWRDTARQLGVAHVERVATSPSQKGQRAVTVVAGRPAPNPLTDIEGVARQLALAAHITACTLLFLADRPTLVGSMPWWETDPGALGPLIESQRSQPAAESFIHERKW